MLKICIEMRFCVETHAEWLLAIHWGYSQRQKVHTMMIKGCTGYDDKWYYIL